MATLRELLTEALEKNSEKFEDVITLEIFSLTKENKYYGDFNALLQALDNPPEEGYNYDAFTMKNVYYVRPDGIFRQPIKSETDCSDNLRIK